MTCVSCIRWRRLIMGRRVTSRYGYCRAPKSQHPIWLDARYPGTAAADRPLENSPLMPDIDGVGCLAGKAKRR